jgi:hypothetical protein
VPRGDFNIKVDTKAVSAALKKFPAAYARESGIALEEIADGTIANIRRRQIWAKETVGVLKKGLWRGEPSATRGNREIDMGWSGEGAAFGPGHEWGTFPSSWVVKPVNTRVSMMDSGRRIGQPIKALRFVIGGRVIFRKGPITIHPPKELKPHWAPAIKAFPVEKTMGRALSRAISRVGLSESEASTVGVAKVGVVSRK